MTAPVNAAARLDGADPAAPRSRSTTARAPIRIICVDVSAFDRTRRRARLDEPRRAIRRIATAWVRSGFDPDDLTRPWTDPRIERLFNEQPDLVDALDDIVRVATRVDAA